MSKKTERSSPDLALCADGVTLSSSGRVGCCSKPTAAPPPESGKRKPVRRSTIIAAGTTLLLLLLATLATNIRRALFSARSPDANSPSPSRYSLAGMMGRTATYKGRGDDGFSAARGGAIEGRGGGAVKRKAGGMEWPGALPNTGRSIGGDTTKRKQFRPS